MCPPTYFEVSYSINPWMDPDRPVDQARALAQWQWLVDAFLDLSHKVDLVDPVPGLPDMVFAANAAVVVDRRVLVARFRNRERRPETPAFLEWFRTHGYPEARVATRINEGEGDHLLTRDRILAARGFRTEPAAHAEVARFFDRPVLALDLVDPRFYHLDTALAVLDADNDEIMYYPGAFSGPSRAMLEKLYPDAIQASEADAEVLGLNAVSDGRNVLLPAAAAGLATRLRGRGFHPVGLDLSELHKAGGGIKCCTLEIRDG
jgi:N-dimethylarginine dimethylaminohydrolase